jgi:hypothetical protein
MNTNHAPTLLGHHAEYGSEDVDLKRERGAMPSRTVQPNLPDKPRLPHKLAKLRYLPSTLKYKLGMKTKANLNSRRGINNTIGPRPSKGSGRHGQDVALLADRLRQNGFRIRI